ncbi:MAG: hypothetical protein JW871_01030 [Endomicrobiales bacterium]|nr:hypothetical protein [Endomicrobiales bacterium]
MFFRKKIILMGMIFSIIVILYYICLYFFGKESYKYSNWKLNNPVIYNENDIEVLLFPLILDNNNYSVYAGDNERILIGSAIKNEFTFKYTLNLLIVNNSKSNIKIKNLDLNIKNKEVFNYKYFTLSLDSYFNDIADSVTNIPKAYIYNNSKNFINSGEILEPGFSANIVFHFDENLEANQSELKLNTELIKENKVIKIDKVFNITKKKKLF